MQRVLAEPCRIACITKLFCNYDVVITCKPHMEESIFHRCTRRRPERLVAPIRFIETHNTATRLVFSFEVGHVKHRFCDVTNGGAEFYRLRKEPLHI